MSEEFYYSAEMQSMYSTVPAHLLFSRRLTMQLSDTSSIAQHFKKKIMTNNSITENSYRKQNKTKQY